MARGSIKDFRPAGVRMQGRFYSLEDIDAVIQAVGTLPKGAVSHTRVSDDGSKLISRWTNRKIVLAERLEAAAIHWDFNEQMSYRPSSAQLEGQFERIEKAANRLLVSLQGKLTNDPPAEPTTETPDVFDTVPTAIRRGVMGSGGGLQSFAAVEAEALGGLPEWTGEGMLHDAVQDVYRLRKWAREARQRRSRKPKRARDERHVGDEALDIWFGNLVGIWTDIFEPRNPFATTINFEEQPDGPLIDFLRSSLTPVLGKKTPSDQAIRERIRRLYHGKGKSKPNES